MKPEQSIRGALAALVAAFLLAATASAAPAARTQAVCDARERIAGTLADDYSERPVARGLANTGAVVELFASPGGTWTLVVTTPGGLTCVVAAGSRWQTLPPFAPTGAAA